MLTVLLLVAVLAAAVIITTRLLAGPTFASMPIRTRAGVAFVSGILIAGAYATVAAAATEPGTLESITVSALSVTLIVSVFIPIITGTVTKLNTSDTVKGVVTLVLNGINAVIVANLVGDGSAVLTHEVLIAALVGMAISVASYLGFYKGVDINSKLLPDKGI